MGFDRHLCVESMPRKCGESGGGANGLAGVDIAWLETMNASERRDDYVEWEGPCGWFALRPAG